jgi:hypothetical protein
MERVTDEDLVEMYSMTGMTPQKQEEKLSPFYSLKKEFERYEKEIHETFDDYQSNLYRDILTSTRQRIKIIEELDEAREDSTIINELRNRIDEVKKKIFMAKSLLNQQKKEMSQSLNRGAVTKPLNRFEQSAPFNFSKKESTSLGRLQYYQEMLGNIVGYFLVFMFSSETFREKLWRVWGDAWYSFQSMINGWKEDLKKKDEQSRRANQRRGFIMRLIMWSWSWMPWSLDTAKRVVVWSNDYLGSVFKGPEPFRGKVMHVVHDAQSTLHAKQEQMKKGIQESLNVGKEMGKQMAHSPVEFLPVSESVKSKIRGVIGSAGSDVELKRRRSTTSSEVQGARAPEVPKR